MSRESEMRQIAEEEKRVKEEIHATYRSSKHAHL